MHTQFRLYSTFEQTQSLKMFRWELLTFFSALILLLAEVGCQQVGTLKTNAVLKVPMEECEAGESCRKGTLLLSV